MTRVLFSMLLVFFVLSGCTDKGGRDGNDMASDMKCGSGKCGANMFDGNSALVKKKKNILFQMNSDDSRRDCVIKAKTTKAAYDCIRNPKTGKMSLKCGSKEEDMKCGTGKCGNS